MSLFTKIFGSKTTADQAAAKPKKADFIAALSLHVSGEREAALGAYQSIAEELPNDALAPFFAAAIKAASGDAAAAAESLRQLSGHVAAQGENISRVMSLELLAQVGDQPLPLSVPAVAEIIASFGDQLRGGGFLQESAVCLEIAAGLIPDNPHLLHKFGDTLHDLRIYDYAESVLQDALKHAPNHWGALYTYAVLLQDLGRDAEAIACYEKAVTFNPDHANCQNNYGAALLRTNRVEEALVHCTLAEGLDPKSPLVKVNLGNIRMLLQEYETARTCFSEAIALNDNFAPAYFGLASVEQSLGSDPTRVRELYLKGIEINPLIPEAHQALGNLLADDGNPQALAHFATAAQLNGNLKHLRRDFGRACLLLERRQEAEEHLKIALQQNPDDAMVQGMLAKLEAEKTA